MADDSTPPKNPEEDTSAEPPFYVRPQEWIRMTGIGQRTTLDLIGEGHLRAVKVGRATLIDYRHGLEWLRNRPPAQIKPQARRKPAA